jgi:hypothetical protein
MTVRPKPTASRRSGIPARPPLTSIPREQANRPRFFLHQHPKGVPAFNHLTFQPCFNGFRDSWFPGFLIKTLNPRGNNPENPPKAEIRNPGIQDFKNPVFDFSWVPHKKPKLR